MSAVYPKAKEAFLGGTIVMATDTIKAQPVDTGAYTYSAAHQFLSDVAAGARIGTAPTLGTKSVTNGVFDAADATVSAITGVTVEAIVIYKDTGSAATSPLIAYIDSGSGLPFTPNGGDLVLAWDNGANKIFAL